MTRGSVPMSARPRRSAWGFAITSRDDWRLQAACRPPVDPELFFNRQTRDVALHICRTHCPVMAQCQETAMVERPSDTVQGGIAWTAAGGATGARGRPLRIDIPPAGTCQLCWPDRGRR